MPTDVNPLVPSGADVLFGLSALLSLLFLVVALVQLWRRREQLSRGALIVWTAIMLLVPTLGPALFVVAHVVPDRIARGGRAVAGGDSGQAGQPGRAAQRAPGGSAPLD